MSESFANAPVSVGELKSAREDDCTLVSERELLIALLRSIDRGDIKPDGLMVVWQTRRENTFCVSTRRAKLTVLEGCGIIEVAKYDLLSPVTA